MAGELYPKSALPRHRGVLSFEGDPAAALMPRGADMIGRGRRIQAAGAKSELSMVRS
jgi:hypothetical protein